MICLRGTCDAVTLSIKIFVAQPPAPRLSCRQRGEPVKAAAQRLAWRSSLFEYSLLRGVNDAGTSGDRAAALQPESAGSGRLAHSSSRALIWGVYVRVYAAVLFIALYGAHRQAHALSSSKAWNPAGELLYRVRHRLWRTVARLLAVAQLVALRDQRGPRSLPDRGNLGVSLLLAEDARSLFLLCLVPALCYLSCPCSILGSFFVFYGGRLQLPGLLMCYSAFMALDQLGGIPYPWEALLTESLWLTMFLPATLPSRRHGRSLRRRIRSWHSASVGWCFASCLVSIAGFLFWSGRCWFYLGLPPRCR